MNFEIREELRSEYLTPFEKIELKQYKKEECETMWTSSESKDKEGNLLEHFEMD